MEHPRSDLGDLALHAARVGAQTISDVVGGGDLAVDTKSSRNDLVTNADRAAERAIVAAIRAARPDDAILGEELGEHAGSSAVRWLVDPVDGTTNFVHGRWDYAVSVGVEQDGEMVAGAVVRPAYGDWVATGDTGVRGSRGTPAVSSTVALDEALVSVGFPHRQPLRPRVLRLLEALGPRIRDFRRVGSACCDLYSVATGMLDAFVGVAQAPWDVAGGWPVVQAAGGRAGWLTTAGGLDVFVAGTPAVAAALEELLRADLS